jgi:hypothetical protein
LHQACLSAADDFSLELTISNAGCRVSRSRCTWSLAWCNLRALHLVKVGLLRARIVQKRSNMNLRAGILLVSALSLGTGCLAGGQVSGRMEASADPMLVEIDPGIWVIEDYSEPVFYVEGYYWLYRDDAWFRSSHHAGGWARVQSVPQVVVRIERPTAYVHYRATRGVRVRRGPRGTVIVRDHDDRNPPRTQPSEPRGGAPDPRPQPPGHQPRPNPPQHDRDKLDKRDDKHETKQDKRDDKRDTKQDKRDDKQGGDRRDQHR